jgi:hypothetical protein
LVATLQLLSPWPTVTATTIKGKAIYLHIEETKKVNMDPWFTKNPEIYQTLLSAITPQVNYAAPLLPAQQVSPQPPKPLQLRAGKQNEYRVPKGKTITSQLHAKESTNMDGKSICILGEVDKAFEDTLLETPCNACKEHLQLIQANIKVMKAKMLSWRLLETGRY